MNYRIAEKIMAFELLYTSAPQGLQPGVSGFCTVAMTHGLPQALAEKLELLSAYRPIFPPSDARAHLNPILHAYVRLQASGKTYHVLSRIGPSGLDYSDRPNKFAHHIALESGELPPGGPAWLIQQPGVMRSQWDGRVGWLHTAPIIPQGLDEPGPCRTWQQLVGDAGWGGVVVESLLGNLDSPTILIFQPGMPMLDLVAEVLRLLPAERRWHATFTSYYGGAIQGVAPVLRCVLHGSAEAKASKKLSSALCLDLAERFEDVPMGQFVEAARTGRVLLALDAARSSDSTSESALGEPRNAWNNSNAGSVVIGGATGSARTTGKAVATSAAPPPLPVNELSRRGTFRSAILGFAAGAVVGLILAICVFAAWDTLKATPTPRPANAVLARAHQAEETGVIQKKREDGPAIEANQKEAFQARTKALGDQKDEIITLKKKVDAEKESVEQQKLDVAAKQKQIEEQAARIAADQQQLANDEAKLKKREQAVSHTENILLDREQALRDEIREPAADKELTDPVRPIQWYYTLPGVESAGAKSTVILSGPSGTLEDFTTPDTSLRLLGLEDAAHRENIKLKDRQGLGGLMYVEIVPETGAAQPICCFAPNKGKLEFEWLPGAARLLTARRAVRNTILEIAQRDQAKRYVGLLHEPMRQPIVFEPKQDGSYPDISLFQKDEFRPTTPLLVLASECRIEKELAKKVAQRAPSLELSFLLRGKLSLSVCQRRTGEYKLALVDAIRREPGSSRQYPTLSVRMLSLGTEIRGVITEVASTSSKNRSGPNDRLRSNR
jgi:hypothetical protein